MNLKKIKLGVVLLGLVLGLGGGMNVNAEEVNFSKSPLVSEDNITPGGHYSQSSDVEIINDTADAIEVSVEFINIDDPQNILKVLYFSIYEYINGSAHRYFYQLDFYSNSIIKFSTLSSGSNGTLHLSSIGLRENAMNMQANGTISFNIKITLRKPDGTLIQEIISESNTISTGSFWSISNDDLGGDCNLIGTWDDSNLTCKLKQDINGTISIIDDDLTLDGSDYLIQGEGGDAHTNIRQDSGIYSSNKNGLNIKNVNINGFWSGISMNNLSNSIIENTDISYGLDLSDRVGSYGLKMRKGYPFFKSDSNIIRFNNIHNTFCAVYIGADQSIIEKNNFNDNERGIIIGQSLNNQIVNNIFTGHQTDNILIAFGKNVIIAGNNIHTGNPITNLNGSGDIYRNNFFTLNKPQSSTSISLGNSLPIGGNYWSNFDDEAEGCFDNNSDGICDDPYMFSDGQDDFPWTEKDGWLNEIKPQCSDGEDNDDDGYIDYPDDLHCENAEDNNESDMLGIEMISVSSEGIKGNNYSNKPSISADGRYVAFESFASNLISNDNNSTYDIFVHDRVNDTTTRVSVSSEGIEGNNGSINPSISADGRYVAFESRALNLVPDDTNNVKDIFVHDCVNNTTTRVSVSSEGVEGDNSSLAPSISADGRYIAFYSNARNLIPNDTNWARDIFVHDCINGTTTQVAGDNNSHGSSFAPSISADGRYIAFYSSARNLILNDTNNLEDIFVHDRVNGTITRVSVSSEGIAGNGSSFHPSISADGRYISFYSGASNLVPNDTNNAGDIFVHDRINDTTTRVSVSSEGVEGKGAFYYSSISAEGRYISFPSGSSDLVPNDTNNAEDIFVHDRINGTTTRVSVSSEGVAGNGFSYAPSISADGRYISFHSDASNLVPDDRNYRYDVFVVHNPLLDGGLENQPPGDFELIEVSSYCDTQEPVGPAVKLEWEPSVGAQSYEIYRNDVKYITLPSSETIFENNVGIVVGQEYEYYVKAVNDVGETESVNKMTVKILDGVCDDEIPEELRPYFVSQSENPLYLLKDGGLQIIVPPKAYDKNGNDISDRIVRDGWFDNTQVGTYEIKYNVIDDGILAVEYVQQVIIHRRPDKPSDIRQHYYYSEDRPIVMSSGYIIKTDADESPRVAMFGIVTDPDGDDVRIEVELRRMKENDGQYIDEFDESEDGFSVSNFATSGTRQGVGWKVSNGEYHWRARTVDEHGAESDWVYYSNLIDDNPDFIVHHDFSFVHMTDVHLGEHSLSMVEGGGSYKSYPRFTDGLYEIDKNVEPDFILMGGDLVEWAEQKYLEDYQSFIEQYDIPVYNIPGNHDRYQNDSFDEVWNELRDATSPGWMYSGEFNDDLEKFISIINSPEDTINGLGEISILFDNGTYDEEKDIGHGINKYNYTFEHNGFLFIGLDSGENADIDGKDGPKFLGGDEGPEGSGLSDLHMQKLNKLNELYGNIPKIIFIHHPIITGEKDDDCRICQLIADPIFRLSCEKECKIYEDASIVDNWEEFVGYCQNQENNVQLVLSGHTHKDVIFDKNKNKINNNLSNWDETYPLFIQTRSATKDDYGYRVIEVVNGKVKPQKSVPTDRNYKKVISDLDVLDTNDDLDFEVYDSMNNLITPENKNESSVPFFIHSDSNKVILYEEEVRQSVFAIKNNSLSINSEYNLLVQKRGGDIEKGDGIYRKFGFEFYDDRLSGSEFLIFDEDKEEDKKQDFAALDFRGININNSSNHLVMIRWSELEIEPIPFSINLVRIYGLSYLIDHDSISSIYKRKFYTNTIDLNSPGELQVYDNNGNVTGLVDGEVKEEIPYSLYVPETETVYVFSDEGENMADNLRTRVVGSYEDTYDLSIIVEEYDEEKGRFMANDIPTDGTTTHQFSIDWQALSQGEKGVTMEIDEGSDGVFDETIISDATMESLIANAGESYESIEGTEMTFDASLSTDLDGNIVLYEWDFDGDGNYDESSTLPTITYTYGDDYSGEVILKVTDDEGLIDVDTADVQIDNVDSEIEYFSNQTIEVLDEFVFENSFTDTGWLDTHDAKIEWGDGIEEDISLTEENEFPEASGEVIGSHTYNVPGIYTVILYITDDDGGVGTSKFEIIVEKRKTELIYAGDLSGQYSDEATLQAILTDKLGGVEGKTVNFNLGSQFVSAVTNSEGIAEIKITLNEIPGVYEVETSFLEDEFYLSFSDLDEFEIMKDDTVLSIPNGEIVYSDDATVQVTLHDDENEFLLKQVESQKTVYLEYFNGTQWRHITKDALYSTDDTDDTLNLSFQIPDNFDEIAGNYDLRARFSGDDYYNETISETGNLEILKEDVVLSDPSITVTYSDSSTLEITLQDNDGETLLHQSDESKVAYLEVFDGAKWKTLSEDSLNPVDNSDETLTFTFEIQEDSAVDLSAGDYELGVRFDGDSRYNSTITNGTLTIVRESVVITVEDQEGYFGETVLLEATILDDDGEKLYHDPNKVTFSVGGNVVGEDEIDENGKAKISWLVDYIPTDPNESYPIEVSFSENEYYLSSEGQGEFNLKSAKQLKEDTLAKLRDIKTDNKQAQKEIDKAIEDVEDSLNLELWTDSSRLDEQQGHKVFDREKQAVKSLFKIIEEKGKHIDPEVVAELRGVINDLVKVDILLAKTAIYDAENIEADDTDLQKKIDDEINKAKEELEKVSQELADDSPDKAIDHLKKSWKSAQLAIDFLLDKTNRWRNSFENGT